MAFAILGIPRPHFIDSSGSPLASGTVTIQNPSDSAVKASYPTAAKADSDTDGTSADVSLNARGQPDQDLWGRDNEDYKIIVKNSAAATQDTWDAIRMPVHNRRSTVTTTSADATPTIAESKYFILGGTSNVTDFDDGEVGDVIFLRSSAGPNPIVHDGSNITLQGGQNFNMQADDTLTLAMFVDQQWVEVGRSQVRDGPKYKTADESLTSSTLANDTHLLGWSLLAATYYKFDGFLKVTADQAARDLEIDIVTDQAFQEECYSWISVDAGSALTVDQAESSALTAAVANIDIDGTGDVGILLSGYVFTHATAAATVDVQFANQAGAGTVTVNKGSWIQFEQMGQ